MTQASAQTSGGDKPKWQVPSNWKEAAAGQFLVAKYTITGPGNAQAAVNVSTSAGTGGGLAGNINRWRGQLGLGQLSDAEITQMVTTLDSPSGKAMLVDMSGTDARTGEKSRLIGAIVPRDGATWFYKLMGNEQVVESQKEAFANFIRTATYK